MEGTGARYRPHSGFQASALVRIVDVPGSTASHLARPESGERVCSLPLLGSGSVGSRGKGCGGAILLRWQKEESGSVVPSTHKSQVALWDPFGYPPHGDSSWGVPKAVGAGAVPQVGPQQAGGLCVASCWSWVPQSAS